MPSDQNATSDWNDTGATLEQDTLPGSLAPTVDNLRSNDDGEPNAPDPFDVHASLYPPANPAAGDAKDKGDKAKETDKMATVSVFPDSGLDTMSLRTTYTYKRPISVLREHRQRSCRHQQ